MRTRTRTFAFLALLASLPARAEDPAAAATSGVSSGEGTAAEVGDAGVFRLRSGGTLAGTLVARDAAGDTFRLVSGQVVVLEPGAVERRIGALEVQGYVWPSAGDSADPGELRHVHVPSAVGPGSNRLVVTASGVEAGVAYGWSRWAASSLGVAAPVLLGSARPVPALTAGVDVRAPLPWGLHVCTGLRGFASRGGRSLHLSGTVTWALPVLTLSLHAGPSMPGAPRLGSFGDTEIALAATARLSRSFAASIEGFRAPAEGSDLAGAAAVRWLSPSWALDVGSVVSERKVFPWIAVTWSRQLGGAR